MPADECREIASRSGTVPGPTAEAFDPVLEAFERLTSRWWKGISA
jgi:hypothetical protein